MARDKETSKIVSAFPGSRILVVDDEQSMRRALGGLFARLGHTVTVAASGPEALKRLAAEKFDLVVLDLKMPDMDGTEVLQIARPLAPETVFIFLTAYGTLESAIAGLRYGAFDYLLKPSPIEDIVRAVESGLEERHLRSKQRDPVGMLEEALATLRSAPRETRPPEDERFLRGPGITVDVLKRLVVLEGEPISTTPTEFEILAYLMRNRERVVSCSELVSHVRGYELGEQEARALLRSHIHRLRHKLESEPGSRQLIHTIRGSGYMISANTT